jgi:uncharacterized membrane protein YphA (DoxX/SURF4 family)
MNNDMDTKRTTFAQLFLRVAISISFLSAVADRLGMWGAPGEHGVAWGNWKNFVVYSQAVNSFAGEEGNRALAVIATLLETLLPALLLAGYKIRLAAIASGSLLACFALAMTFSFGIKPSLDYSVWTAAAACFALSTFHRYPFSIDAFVART